MTKVWLIDFDDTLAIGPVTWGYQHVLPRFIKEYDLPADFPALERSVLKAQEQSNQSTDLNSILSEFFVSMNWPTSLSQSLLLAMEENYNPQLFDDAKPFLDTLNEAGKTVVILSNNPHTPDSAKKLGLHDLVDDIVTPHMLPGAGPKPEFSLWDQMTKKFPGMNVENTVVVGDDPWSDLAFAEACGLRAWLIDRHDRFAGFQLWPRARRVESLLEIELS